MTPPRTLPVKPPPRSWSAGEVEGAEDEGVRRLVGAGFDIVDWFVRSGRWWVRTALDGAGWCWMVLEGVSDWFLYEEFWTYAGV